MHSVELAEEEVRNCVALLMAMKGEVASKCESTESFVFFLKFFSC